ncbi:hypothetical protein GCM10025734_75160 [Kitasatospora paranensis]
MRHRTAQLLLTAGDHSEALTVLLQLLLDTERRYGPHHPLAAETRRTLEWLGRPHG